MRGASGVPPPSVSGYRWSSSFGHPRTQLERIIRRAGLEPWPKLFQNLRSSRETELAREWPLHVVTEWIGNSQPVALKHYLQVTDEDYERASSLPNGAPEVAQNPVQQAHAWGCRELHSGNGIPDKRAGISDLQHHAEKCAAPNEYRLGPEGPEHPIILERVSTSLRMGGAPVGRTAGHVQNHPAPGADKLPTACP